MSNKAVMIVVTIASVLLWAGMIYLMNIRPPDMLNRIVFFAICTLALLTTLVPLSYALNAKLGKTRGYRGDMNRALRQGALVCFIAVLIFGLYMLGMLNWFVAILLCLVVVLIEVTLGLRGRHL